MVTVHREGGLRVVIFTDDHEPAHVHVFGDGAAKINLAGADNAPELVSAEGMKRSDIRKAMRIVKAGRDQLLQCWRDIHG
jgi:histidinol phosphatase-like PHP family hydrolase